MLIWRNFLHLLKSTNKELNNWTHDQRKAKARLSPERKKKLDALGFIWSIKEEELQEWETFFDRFKALKLKHEKNYLLILRKETDLEEWFTLQLHFKSKLSKYKKDKLNSINFPWKRKELTKDQLWQERYEELLQYKDKYGHCKVERKHNPRLYSWVMKQRQYPISTKYRKQLESIGFTWNNEMAEEHWEERYKKAKELKETLGEVKAHSQSELGRWLYHQRKNKERLREERKQKLEEIGVI